MHGKSYSKIYKVWSAMKDRCNNPFCKSFKQYGARGIAVSKSWHKFENFYRDMGDAPKGLTLERIDNEKGYSKNNCRWATQKEQVNNRRITSVCRNGHKRTKENTYKTINADGYKVNRCRDCNNAAVARYEKRMHGHT